MSAIMGHRRAFRHWNANGPLPVSCLVVALFASLPGAARGQAAPPDASARRDAAAAFAEGERAFAGKDYALAASRFLEAYRLAPHPNALWNEARALLHAGEKAGAANAYLKYLREAPMDALDRAEASRSLDDLEKKLVRIDIEAPGFDTVLVDDRRADGASVYVGAGRHVVEGHKGEHVARADATGEAGTVVPVTLTAPDSGSTPTPTPTPTPTSTSTSTSTSTPTATATATATTTPTPTPTPTPLGWSPLVVWVGSGITAAAIGAVVWSGLDTLTFRTQYDATSSPTAADYDTGVQKMHRTNGLLVLAAGAAALTTAAAIFFVDWRSPSGARAALVVAPGSAGLCGTFQ